VTTKKEYINATYAAIREYGVDEERGAKVLLP
jgi:hypothetical protein